MRRDRHPAAPGSGALVLLATLVLGLPSFAQVGADASGAPPETEELLRQARSHMQQLEYEEAIALLEPVLATPAIDTALLGETYLLLVEAHVYRGNLGPPGTKERQLWYDEAAKLVHDCLARPDLRHIDPDPPESYPAEMVQLFAAARREMFGTFEIGSLDPSDAEVLLGGAPLVRDADGALRRTAVPIGRHVLLVRRPGYREIVEDLEISPATVSSRSFSLERDRGFGWYATRVIAPVAAVVGAAVVIATRGGQEETPFPPPPNPPSTR